MKNKVKTPLITPIKPKKTEQWYYKIHPYFTRQAGNVVSEYIKYYTNEGDIILDPFVGTGVTAVEGLRLKRRTISVDIAPIACFITRQTCYAPFDLEKYHKILSVLKKNCQEEVDFVRNASKEEINAYRIKHWYPKKVKMPKNSDFDYVEDLFHKKQLIVLSKLMYEINKIRDSEVKDAFKLVFSNTITRTNLSYMPSIRDGKQVGGGGASFIGKYRFWKPKKPVVLDVWKNFENRTRYFAIAKVGANKDIGNYFKEPNKNYFKEKDATFWVIKDTATNLKMIPDSSIDYIYTDPPYGAHIAYLDLSTMWHAWLNFEVTESDKEIEIIEGGDKSKSRDEYKELLYESISEMARVIKKDSWLSIVFQHKDVELWNSIQDACKRNGFQYNGSVYQPTKTTSIHKKTNPLVVMGSQLIINFIRTDKKINSSIKLKDEKRY